MPFREDDFLRLVRARAADPAAPRAQGLVLGIGDDAAILDAQGRQVVVTADLLLDGVDVVLAECGPRAAGAKAVKKSLSDLAAMGVEPWLAFLCVALPAGAGEGFARALLDGAFEAAGAHGCVIAGGDTKRSSGPLVVDVIALGRARRRAPPVRRSGAQPGDAVVVTGALGGAALGGHLGFEPRVRAGLRLNEVHAARAMMDLSDGLAIDLHRLCEASGVGARIDAATVPLAAAARAAASQDGRPPLRHALEDGEDYELLAALPTASLAAALADAELGAPLAAIGVFTAEREVVLVEDGTARPLPRTGFLHHFGGGA